MKTNFYWFCLPVFHDLIFIGVGHHPGRSRGRYDSQLLIQSALASVMTTSVLTTQSVTDQVLIFLLISSLLFSRLARARLLRRALI